MSNHSDGDPAPDSPVYPKLESSQGVLFEHFDLLPSDLCEMIYPHVLNAAQETAALAVWAFRAYTSGEIPLTIADFHGRQLRSFPLHILWRDGIEPGPYSTIVADVRNLLSSGNRLLV